MFDEKKFNHYLKNADERKDVVRTLKSLIRMDIPIPFIRKVIQKVEKFIRKESYWKAAMKLVRKLELKEKYPDLSEYAPKLKESKAMERGWRRARIEKLDEMDWMKRREKRMELKKVNEHFDNRQKVKFQGGDGFRSIHRGSNENWKKLKKKHKKRTRRKHYSRDYSNSLPL